MIKFNFRKFSVLMLLAFFTIMALMFTGCRTKQSTVDKTKEKTIEINANDIKTSNKVNIETATYKVTQLKNLKLKSQDPEKPSKIIYKGDTLSFTNAEVDLSSDTTTEDNSSSSSEESGTEDNSTSSKEKNSSETLKDKKVQSASWGLNIGIFLGIIVIIVLVYFHFQKPKHPLA